VSRAPRDWYRTADWDEQGRADFERDLGRARPDGRAQYLNLKAMVLLEAGGADRRAGAVELAERAIALAPENLLEVSRAHGVLADAALAGGDREAAIEHLRAVVTAEDEHGHIGSPGGVRLARLLLDLGTDGPEIEEAARLLDRAAEGGFGLYSEQWDHDVARALWAERAGDADGAAFFAGRALGILDADAAGPQFARHPDVRVRADRRDVAEMRRLAGRPRSRLARLLGR
jgi:hypothetical protein